MLYVNPIANLDAYRDAGLPDNLVRRKAALQELERLFAFSLVQEMRKSVPEDGLLGHPAQRRLFDEMLDDALAGAMAKSGQLGLARQIESQLAATDSGASSRAVKGVPSHADR